MTGLFVGSPLTHGRRDGSVSPKTDSGFIRRLAGSDPSTWFRLILTLLLWVPPKRNGYMVVVGKHFTFLLIFAYCGLVGKSNHSTAKTYSLLPFQRQPRVCVKGT